MAGSGGGGGNSDGAAILTMIAIACLPFVTAYSCYDCLKTTRQLKEQEATALRFFNDPQSVRVLVELRTKKAQTVETEQLGDVIGVKVKFEDKYVELCNDMIITQNQESHQSKDKVLRPIVEAFGFKKGDHIRQIGYDSIFIVDSEINSGDKQFVRIRALKDGNPSAQSIDGLKLSHLFVYEGMKKAIIGKTTFSPNPAPEDVFDENMDLSLIKDEMVRKRVTRAMQKYGKNFSVNIAEKMQSVKLSKYEINYELQKIISDKYEWIWIKNPALSGESKDAWKIDLKTNLALVEDEVKRNEIKLFLDSYSTRIKELNERIDTYVESLPRLEIYYRNNLTSVVSVYIRPIGKHRKTSRGVVEREGIYVNCKASEFLPFADPRALVQRVERLNAKLAANGQLNLPLEGAEVIMFVPPVQQL